MSAGPLLVHGGILIDDLAFIDGRRLDGVLGGAALHALAGAALWDDDVLLIGGVGQDADVDILPWMDAAKLSSAALKIDGEFTPRNIFVYRADGTRTETPAFGPEHFARLQPGAVDLAARLPGARGAYVFRDADLEFWTPALAAARDHGVPLLWEISAEACTPSREADIATITHQIDGLSLNLEEAAAIFGAKSRRALIEDVRRLGARVAFLRCGAAGSVVIWAQETVSLPAYPAAVVDVTGAGNAYGGGALAGLANGADPVRAGQMGAIASRFALGQNGLFAPRDAAVRAVARDVLNAAFS